MNLMELIKCNWGYLQLTQDTIFVEQKEDGYELHKNPDPEDCEDLPGAMLNSDDMRRFSTPESLHNYVRIEAFTRAFGLLEKEIDKLVVEVL